MGAEHLAELTLWPDGSLIESLDIHISVHGMVMAALRVLVPRPVMAGVFAAQGGSATSKAGKTTSSRENGKKGGRPRKAPPRKAA